MFFKKDFKTSKLLTSENLLWIKRLTSADLPTRTSPTRTTLQSWRTSSKRCLTLPILLTILNLDSSTLGLKYSMYNWVFFRILLSQCITVCYDVWNSTEYFQKDLPKQRRSRTTQGCCTSHHRLMKRRSPLTAPPGQMAPSASPTSKVYQQPGRGHNCGM